MLEKLLTKGKRALREGILSAAMLGVLAGPFAPTAYAADRSNDPCRNPNNAARAAFQCQKGGPYFFAGFATNFRRDSKVIEVSDFPESLRTVPGYPGERRPDNVIPQDDLAVTGLWAWSPVEAGFGISTSGQRPWYIKGGAELNVLVEFSSFTDRGIAPDNRIREYEYGLGHGDEGRGSGTALAYYALRFPKLRFRYFGEIGKAISSNRELFLEAGLMQLPVREELGWDRFNALEAYKKYPLADLNIYSLRGGMRFRMSDPSDDSSSYSCHIILGYDRVKGSINSFDGAPKVSVPSGSWNLEFGMGAEFHARP